MPKIIKGGYKSRMKRYGIVVSRFNDFITKRLLKSCVGELSHCGVKDNEVTVVWVSGSLEIPVAALMLAQKKYIDAVICLGVVIRGETFHFEIVAHYTAKGVAEVALQTGKPIIFGVLTTDTVDQAYRRSGSRGDNKGVDAARAAVEMVNCLDTLKAV